MFRGADEEPVRALDGLDLRVDPGQVHCLIGTSGCGKTTCLRLVNRLELPTEGSVRVDGRDVAEQDEIALRRGIGYVIQSGGLFPHMTVEANIGLLCELEGWPRARRRQRVAELLEWVGLVPDEHAVRYPGELSGGQRQRVGIARAMALDPDIVLMDEPFGALDPITRSSLHDELQQRLHDVKKTILLVTHDLAEAFKLGDRISLMHEGRVIQSGTPDDLMQRPDNEFVRQFLAEQLSTPGAGRG